MKKILFVLFIIFIQFNFLHAQKNVGLDNWFNHETNKKTGLIYHYLWTDTAWSGYSRWGDIFTAKGAKISQIAQPTAVTLKPLSVYITKWKHDKNI